MFGKALVCCTHVEQKNTRSNADTPKQLVTSSSKQNTKEKYWNIFLKKWLIILFMWNITNFVNNYYFFQITWLIIFNNTFPLESKILLKRFKSSSPYTNMLVIKKNYPFTTRYIKLLLEWCYLLWTKVAQKDDLDQCSFLN